MDETSIPQDGKSFGWQAGRDGKNAAMRKPTNLAYSPESVAKRLDALFRALNVQQSAVADMLGLDRSSMSKILKGEKALKPDVANAICDLYGVTLEFLYRGQVGGLPVHLSKQVIANLTN